MILANLGLFVALGASTVGSHDHPAPRSTVGARSSAVFRAIQVLRTSRKKDDREDAAENLRKYDWRVFPEAVLALSDSLVLDPSDDVREQAAESLGRMGACLPEAHEALSRAASSDPDHGVRKEARKSLGGLGRRCIADCQICGPLPTGSIIQGPAILPPGGAPILAPTQPVPTSVPLPAESPQLEPLPPAASPLPDVPPPPPTPVGSRARRPGPAPTRIR